MLINKTHYHTDQFGFIKQSIVNTFVYTKEYLSKQGTTPEMARLRIQWVKSLGCEFGNILEVGVGSGVMLNELKKQCPFVDGYDICPNEHVNITLEEAIGKKYDIVFFCDVIEHFANIIHIFDFKFNFAYFSFPWTPDNIPFNYRHAKPNEHIYHIKPEPFQKLCESFGYKIISISNFEDTIRKPWSNTHPNICSVLIKNDY